MRVHLALLFRALPAAALTRRAVTTTLSAWVFLSTNFDGFRRQEPAAVALRCGPKELTQASLAAATLAHRQLQLPPLEAMALFHRQRHGALAWLQSAGPQRASRAMDEVVASVSNTGGGGGGASWGVPPASSGRDAGTPAGGAEGWRETEWAPLVAAHALAGSDAGGRFTPKAEERRAERRAQARGEAGLGYAEWLWQSTQVDTELNLQKGEFTLRQNQV